MSASFQVLSRCPRKKWRYAGDGTPESPIDEALDLVFVIGKIARSIQSLWEICENHTVWKNIVSMKASPNGVKLTELQEGLAVSGMDRQPLGTTWLQDYSCALWRHSMCHTILAVNYTLCTLMLPQHIFQFSSSWLLSIPVFCEGTTIESCRLWLEVLFRQCSVILGTTGSICPSFWSHEHLSQRLPSLVTESVDRTSIVLCKDLLEQVLYGS